jgi:hypothetical protein
MKRAYCDLCEKLITEKTGLHRAYDVEGVILEVELNDPEADVCRQCAAKILLHGEPVAPRPTLNLLSESISVQEMVASIQKHTGEPTDE